MLTSGAEFAGYRIEGLLGQGGMGAVYLARHPRLPRHDALKVLHPALSNEPTYVVRFEREADAAARLSHPAVVAVYDRGMTDGQLWISMQYIRGTDAAAELQMHGRMSLPRATAVVVAVADALDHAHAHGLVHRDVKPDNILLAPNDTGSGERVMLTDFGIAALTGHSQVTSTGSFVATMAYAPLEQLEGRGVDARTDVYALGGVLYELLSGERPFAHLGVEALYAAKVRGDIPDLTARRPDVPDAVAGVVRRAMAPEPGLRFATCGELAAALGRAVAPSPVTTQGHASTGHGTGLGTGPTGPGTGPGTGQGTGVGTGLETRQGTDPGSPTGPGGGQWWPPPPPPTPPPRRRRRGALVALAVGVVVLLAAGVTTFLLLGGGPDAPHGTRLDTDNGQVDLHWDAVAGADSYEVRRDGSHLADTTDTGYTDADVVGGTSYRYSVVTVDDGDRSDPATFRAVTAALAQPQLDQPTTDGLSVTLTWGDVPGAEHYEVSVGGRSLDDSVTATTFTDTAAVVGRQTYVVTAVDDDGGGGDSTSSVVVAVAPWGTMQPIASALPDLVPPTPADTLDQPVAGHTCTVFVPTDHANAAVERITCRFDNGITTIIDRFEHPQDITDDLQTYGSGQIVPWSCSDVTQGQYTEVVASDGTPVELLTFADPDLALFDVDVGWTADHPLDQLKSALFATGIFCP